MADRQASEGPLEMGLLRFAPHPARGRASNDKKDNKKTAANRLI